MVKLAMVRSGATEDGKAKIKSPSGTLSTAEAISVVTNGMALSAHFGDGALGAVDPAFAGMTRGDRSDLSTESERDL